MIVQHIIWFLFNFLSQNLKNNVFHRQTVFFFTKFLNPTKSAILSNHFQIGGLPLIPGQNKSVQANYLQLPIVDRTVD